MRRALSLLVASQILLVASCGGGGGGGGTAAPSPTPTRGTGQATRTPTRDPQGTVAPTPAGGTRTPTPAVTGQRTRTRTPTPIPGSMQELFVRMSGNDENPGTSRDAALRTIARAAALMESGTTVYVGPGRYAGRVAINGRAGSASAPIQLTGDPAGTRTGERPGAVVIDADGEVAALIITRSANVIVDSFLFTGAVPQTAPEPASATAIQIRTGSENVTIRNCIIGNVAEADGIRVNGSSDTLIFNNLLLENDRGILITGDSPRTRVINNTIVTHGRTGIVLALGGGVAPTDTTVLNNLVTGNDNNLAVAVAQGAVASYNGDFNLMFEPGLEDQSAIYSPPAIRGDNDINGDPVLTNAGQGDVHLEPDSPAIDAGTAAIGAPLLSALLQRSTSPDGARDVAPVDIGYHY